MALWPLTIARWADTSATHELNNTTVLTKGSINGSRTYMSLIPTGGQTPPIATEGDRAPWKNAQKNGKNSIASETKNKSIPYISASCTRFVWWPSTVDYFTRLYDHDPILMTINARRTRIIVSNAIRSYCATVKKGLSNWFATHEKSREFVKLMSCNFATKVVANDPAKADIKIGNLLLVKTWKGWSPT